MNGSESVVFSIPGEALLLFAILVWLVFFLIWMSSPKNHMNRWCLAGGIMFGMGVMKEYLYYELGPVLVDAGIWTETFSRTLYSVLSGLFYYLAMPPVLMFCYYFSHMDRERPAYFRAVRILTFLPAAALACIWPCTRIVFYQHDRVFCLTVAAYECCMAFAGTVLLIRTLIRERYNSGFRQRVMAAAGILIPLYCWIVLAFPWHVFGGDAFSKLWQGNVFTMALLLLWLLFRMFHGGIWGLRLRWEHYDWEKGARLIGENAGYVAHALNSELSKIEWSLELLRQQGAGMEELQIIRNSAEHLRRFVRETRIYSDEIRLKPEFCRVSELFADAEKLLWNRGVPCPEIRIVRCDAQPLYCDRVHLTEVLKNLFLNAAEASKNRGGGNRTLLYRTWWMVSDVCLYSRCGSWERTV